MAPPPQAVLSVFATDELLFSASKDRTVKVWDLCRKEEVLSLEGHPNNVVCVKYSEPQRLAYTVSSAFIKVWDLRMNPSSCIKTLSSSGLTTNGPVVVNQSAGSRTLAMPPGETAINDISLTPSGYGLFSAAGDKVRSTNVHNKPINRCDCGTCGSSTRSGSCPGVTRRQ